MPTLIDLPQVWIGRDGLAVLGLVTMLFVAYCAYRIRPSTRRRRARHKKGRRP